MKWHFAFLHFFKKTNCSYFEYAQESKQPSFFDKIVRDFSISFVLKLQWKPHNVIADNVFIWLMWLKISGPKLITLSGNSLYFCKRELLLRIFFYCKFTSSKKYSFIFKIWRRWNCIFKASKKKKRRQIWTAIEMFAAKKLGKNSEAFLDIEWHAICNEGHFSNSQQA